MKDKEKDTSGIKLLSQKILEAMNIIYVVGDVNMVRTSDSMDIALFVEKGILPGEDAEKFWAEQDSQGEKEVIEDLDIHAYTPDELKEIGEYWDRVKKNNHKLYELIARDKSSSPSSPSKLTHKEEKEMEKEKGMAFDRISEKLDEKDRKIVELEAKIIELESKESIVSDGKVVSPSVLRSIDELLAYLEDYTHGKDGERISKMRGRIIDQLYKNKKDKQGEQKPLTAEKMLEKHSDVKVTEIIKSAEFTMPFGTGMATIHIKDKPLFTIKQALMAMKEYKNQA